MVVRELQVGGDAGAVPVGRHFTCQVLSDDFESAIVEAAELVVTELLTNAVLHGTGPVRLVVSGDVGTRARLEVHDASRALPVRPSGSTQGMTGRGLALVDALSADWGVTPHAGAGKAVWAELTPDSVRVSEPGDVDLDALLAAFDDAPDDGPVRYTVVLGDVPTDLLLAAKAHVDSVVRELTLADSGAQSGVTAAVPSSLSELVHGVVTQFAEARQAIKRQALAASAAGRDRTTLRLTLPGDAADAGERYLAALEEADAYGRASRLLTLAAPPQHAAFRRWYVTSLVDVLRRAQQGEPDVAAPTFEDYLLAEVDHLAELQRVSDRAARLQRVTALLAVALDRDEVTRITLDDAVAELGASRGVVRLLSPDGLRTGAAVGFPEADAGRLAAGWDQDARTPGQLAWTTGQPVWVETREERDERFPAFAGFEPEAVATCAVPLSVAGHLVGMLRLSFSDSRLFSDDERAFLTALGAVAAQALERADLHDAEAALAERLVRLQAVTSALSTSGSVEDVLDVTIQHAVGLVGAHTVSVSLLRDDARTIDLVRIRPQTAEGGQWATYSLFDDVPAAEAVRSGEFLWARDVRSRDARWPAIASTARGVEHSLAAMPLHAEGTTIGALTLSFPADPHREDPSPEFLMAFADACAQAIQRARAAERAAEAHRRLSFLAEASEALGGTLDIETTLGNLARLAVPAVADWCVLHLLQDDELVCVAVEHVDPVLRGRAVAAQARWPETLGDAGVGLVVRTGEPMLVPSVAQAREQALAAGLPQPEPEHQALLDELGLRSALLVPLVARGRALGAITFLAAESGRTYGPDDLAFTADLGRRAAVAVDNARLYAVAAGRVPTDAGRPTGLVSRPRARSLPGHADDALLRWHLAQEAGRLGSWDLDVPTGRLVWDEQCAALYGTTLDDFEGELAGFTRRTHPDDVARVDELLRRTVETGAPLDLEHRVRLPDGTVRHLLSRGRALLDEQGRTDRLVGAVVDVTDLREAAVAESRAARLLAALGDVALQLAAASTVEELTRVVMDRGLALLGADGGAVGVRDDQRGTVRLSVSESLDEQVPEELMELPLDGPLPGSVTARTGEAVLLPTRASGLAFSPAMQVVYDGTGRGAWVSLPLRSADRLLGSLVVSWADEREFDQQDVETLSAFAAQCAQALDRVQVLEAERRAAAASRRLSETLQRSLLTLPPEPDHLEIAVRYAPASQEAQVGGDWYDAFFTADGALNLVIGDCSGHDREAVAAMAAVRNLLRATAYAVDGTPSEVLAALERTMDGLDVSALATVTLARIQQDEEQRSRGVREVVWSSAGHLPLLVRRADGATVVLDTPPDLLLGLLPQTDRGDHRVELEAGASLVLYTDGLVERRGEDIDAGIERLRRVLTEVGELPLEQVCDTLLHLLGGDAEDDVALLAVRFHDEDQPLPAHVINATSGT